MHLLFMILNTPLKPYYSTLFWFECHMGFLLIVALWSFAILLGILDLKSPMEFGNST